MTFSNFDNPLIRQIFGGAPSKKSQNQTPTISEAQFFSLTSTLDRQSLKRLVQQARARGISDKDIQEGLDILLNHR